MNSPSHCQDVKKSRSELSPKLFSKSELRSSIPKPSPCLRNREARAMSSSSCHSQPVHPSKIPLPVFRSADRGKTSISLHYRPSTPVPNANPKHHKPSRPQLKRAQTVTRPLSPNSKHNPRPKSASVPKNPYPHIKAKVNSKIKSELSPTTARVPRSEGSSVAESKIISSVESTAVDQSDNKTLNSDEILEKQKHLLSIYTELKKIHPSKDIQPLEREICQLMQNKTLAQLEGLSRDNSLLLNDGSPEFLCTFEKQMRDLSQSWLKLICEMVSIKLAAGHGVLARISMPDPTLDVREEMYRFLNSLPTEGEPLLAKLQKVEEDQVKMMTVVLHSVMALSKEHEDLKDKHFRLEKTQDQIHFELKEELAILGEENKDLDKKYALAVEKYNLEKSKTEQQEKHKFTIHREIAEVKKIMKCMDGKCMEWENKVKKMEAVCRSLEMAVRNKDVTMEKDGKQHRELLTRYNETKDALSKLKSELTESNEARISLEATNIELQDELTAIKCSHDDNLQKRNELVEELSNKTKKLNETEGELDRIKACMTNSNLCSRDTQDVNAAMHIKDLTKEVHLRNIQIQEMKKKMNNMEHMLKDKSTREEILLRQVTDLQKQPLENDVSLRSQIKELHYIVKDLTDEKAELEKIIAEKTLELDQRDLLMQQHSQVLRARDDLIPMIQTKQRNEKECIERLSAVVYEHHKTYYNQAGDRFCNRDDQNAYETMKALEKRYALDPKMVEKELSFRQEKMTELYNLLEHKQMEMMRLERRLRELQGDRDQKELIEREQQQRISSLQQQLNQNNTNKSRVVAGTVK